MGYTLKFSHPHFPDEHEFGLAPLGVFKNGEAREINEDEERLFVAQRGVTLADAVENNSHIELSGNSTLSADETKSLLPPPEVIPEELPDMKKAELVDLAEQHGLDPSGKKKDELVEELGGEPNG